MPHPRAELPFPWSSCHNLPSLSCWVAKQPKIPNSSPPNVPMWSLWSQSFEASSAKQHPHQGLSQRHQSSESSSVSSSESWNSCKVGKVGKTIRQSRTTETCRADTLQLCTCPPHVQPQPAHGTSARPRRLLQSFSIQFTVGVANSLAAFDYLMDSLLRKCFKIISVLNRTKDMYTMSTSIRDGPILTPKLYLAKMFRLWVLLALGI